MQIISKIEINYFRCIYSINLSQNNDVNILIGGNDSGKSNILKALNLFFNNQTELQNHFNFADDLSRLREEQARSTKGRAFLWIRITFNNFLKWKSLPNKFSVKRTWNRYSDQAIDTYPVSISTSTIARFLNKISFHYIPAVRGRDIFSHYLSSLHDALIEDEKAGVKEATASLMGTINESTDDMSKRIKDGLGFISNIQVPKDLRNLFSALDFSTKFSGHDIPLQKRGDGIQARHIPFILDFIARHSKGYHIWAYEEPENSLELGRAFELAEQFRTDFSTENQIFITTHSPAFYDLTGDRITKWFVKPENYKDTDEFITEIRTISQNELADKSLGVAALITSRAKELFCEIKELQEKTENLSQIVISANRPQVIVEGPTDKKILETAFSKLFPQDEQFCEFVSAEGCTNITNYLKTSKNLSKDLQVPIIGLFDNDHAGKKEIKNFYGYKKKGDTSFRIINQKKKIYCGILPLPDEFNELIKKVKESSGNDFQLPLPIEFMFPSTIINRAVSERILELKNRTITAKDSELSAKIDLSKIVSNYLPDNFKYFAYKIDDNSKNNFSDWVNGLIHEDFNYFKPLFEIIKGLIGIENAQGSGMDTENLAAM